MKAVLGVNIEERRDGDCQLYECVVSLAGAGWLWWIRITLIKLVVSLDVTLSWNRG